MKKALAYTALLTIILIGSYACSDNDGYSLGDFRISIATVVPEGDTSYYLLLDNGDKLRPSMSDVYYSAKANQRVFLNYTILSDGKDNYDYYVKINDIWNILTKPVIDLTEANADSIGNDAVRINQFWIGNDYLNTSFLFNYGGVRPHAINLVQNKIMSGEDNAEVLELELRHNSFNSQSNRLYEGLACFDLKPFREEGKDSIPIKILVKDWDGEKEYNVMYKYNELNKTNHVAAMPTISSNEYE